MHPLIRLMTELGGVVHIARLIERGVARGSVLRAARQGLVCAVRPGIYAVPDAPGELVRAARVGGRLAGSSALGLSGVWMPPAHGLDVEVSRSASRLRHPDVSGRMLPDTGVRIFWASENRRLRDGLGVVPLTTAVTQMLGTEPELFAVAMLDSVLRRTGLSEFDLLALAETVPQARHLIGLVDRRAESGSESVVRALLARAGIPARPQVPIPFTDLERFDLLVGDRLVIECDSDAHHSSREQRLRDLSRDARAAALGFVVLRFDYSQIMFEPEAVLASVQGVVGAGIHLDGSRRG